MPSAAHVSDQRKVFILIIVILIPVLRILIPVLRILFPVLRMLIPILRILILYCECLSLYCEFLSLSLPFRILILLQFPSRNKAKTRSRRTEHKHHQRRAGAFPGPEEQYRQHVRCLHSHERFADLIHKKSAQRQPDRNRKELQRISAGIHSAL